MRIKDYKCSCGFDEFFFMKKNNQLGIYCERCGKWYKWANNDENNLYDYQQIHNRINVNVGIKTDDPNISIPIYKFDDDAGLDLRSNEDAIINPGETKVLHTGIHVELPSGYAFEVSPRSGITSKTKLRVILGTVDAGYTGEIGVIVDNISQSTLVRNKNELRTINDTDPNYHGSYNISKGDRIAQLKLKIVPKCNWVIKNELLRTNRSDGGFGHTGVV